jgi:hypothetical protein
LNDPGGLLAGNYQVDEVLESDTSESGWSPHLDGLSAERFVEVIETEAVWDVRTVPRGGRTLRLADCEDVACRK